MRIDDKAPVVAEATVELDAAPEDVWDVVADFDRWPEWNRDVTSMSLRGPLAPGTEFRWKAGVPITSRLEAVERPRLLGWTGRTLGIRAMHVWTFEDAGGRTRARSAESWSGLLPRLLRGPLTRQLQKSLEASMPHLRAEVARRTAQ